MKGNGNGLNGSYIHLYICMCVCGCVSKGFQVSDYPSHSICSYRLAQGSKQNKKNNNNKKGSKILEGSKG